MKTLKMSGHSDDIVEVEGVSGADEYGCFQNGDALVHATFIVGGKIRVRALYDGCWSFAIGQVGEDIPLPPWPIRFSNATGYSVLLEIDLPDEEATLFQEKVRK